MISKWGLMCAVQNTLGERGVLRYVPNIDSVRPLLYVLIEIALTRFLPPIPHRYFTFIVVTEDQGYIHLWEERRDSHGGHYTYLI